MDIARTASPRLRFTLWHRFLRCSQFPFPLGAYFSYRQLGNLVSFIVFYYSSLFYSAMQRPNVLHLLSGAMELLELEKHIF